MTKSQQTRNKLINELIAKLTILAFNETFHIYTNENVIIFFERDTGASVEFAARANYINLNYIHKIPIGKNTIKELIELL